MELNELYGWFRGESTARQDLLPDILGDIDDYTKVELARLYEQVLPRYVLALETRTRAGKVTKPFSEEPLKLTKLLLGYFELESTNPEDIGKLGVISFTAQELLDLYNRNPELIGYIKGIEIEDTHLLFDESDPNEIVLKPEFAEIFSKMEKLEHLGLDKIFPNSYIESLASADPELDNSNCMEIATNVRLPHIRQIFQKIQNYIKSLKMDTSDPTDNGSFQHRVVDNFLEELLSDERLSNVTALELISSKKLILSRNSLRGASFFEGLEELKLLAPRCYIPICEIDLDPEMDLLNDDIDYPLPQKSDLILFPNLVYLECSGERYVLRQDVPWFYIGSEEDYILHIVEKEGEDLVEKYGELVEYENGRSYVNLFGDRVEVFSNGLEEYFRSNQRYNLLIDGNSYGPDFFVFPGERVENGILQIESIEEYDQLLTPWVLYNIKDKGLRLELGDLILISEKMYSKIAQKLSDFDIKVDSIILNAEGDIIDQFNDLTDRFKDCLDFDSKIELIVDAIDIESGVDLSKLNETPVQLVLCYFHGSGDSGHYKDGVIPENVEFRINVSEELRKDPTLSLDKIIEDKIKSLGKIKYYPYPEIQMQGIDVTFDGFKSQEIKVVENGDLEKPADLSEVIAEVVEKAGEEYLTHYTSLSLEGFEIKGIGQKFESIKWVELECCDFELEDLEEFLQAFPNLVSVSVNECSFSDTEVNEYLKTK